jgi:hypothetical protein
LAQAQGEPAASPPVLMDGIAINGSPAPVLPATIARDEQGRTTMFTRFQGF